MAKKGRQNKVSKEVANPNVADTEFGSETAAAETSKKAKKK
ncbi:hypothetical protein ACFOU2_12870 [Bacillus songklensis]|uniref:Uncharacterized protein n=1 Tax=Bacillus songklensis TaxID=1069116 RepID=A0ABV8B4X3_9BACI